MHSPQTIETMNNKKAKENKFTHESLEERKE